MPKRHWRGVALGSQGPLPRPGRLFGGRSGWKKPQSELGKKTRILWRKWWFQSPKNWEVLRFWIHLIFRRIWENMNPKSTKVLNKNFLRKKGHSFATGQVNQPKISWKTAGLVGRWPWCFRHLYGCMWQEDVNLLCFVGWNGMGIMGLKLWLFRTLIFSNDIIPTKARGHQLFLVQIYDSCHLSQIYHPLLNKNQQKMQENMMIPFVEY